MKNGRHDDTNDDTRSSQLQHIAFMFCYQLDFLLIVILTRDWEKECDQRPLSEDIELFRDFRICNYLGTFFTNKRRDALTKTKPYGQYLSNINHLYCFS